MPDLPVASILVDYLGRPFGSESRGQFYRLKVKQGTLVDKGQGVLELLLPLDLATTDSSVEQFAQQYETTDATPVGIEFSLPRNAHVLVDVQAIALRVGAARSKVFAVRREFLNTDNVIASSAQLDLIPASEIGGATACSVSVDNSGATGRARVVGVNGIPLRWRLDVQITTVRAP